MKKVAVYGIAGSWAWNFTQAIQSSPPSPTKPHFGEKKMLKLFARSQREPYTGLMYGHPLPTQSPQTAIPPGCRKTLIPHTHSLPAPELNKKPLLTLPWIWPETYFTGRRGLSRKPPKRLTQPQKTQARKEQQMAEMAGDTGDTRDAGGAAGREVTVEHPLLGTSCIL